MNLIRNNQVICKDLNFAIKNYGPDIGTIKGKTTRKTPLLVVNNLVELPDQTIEVNQDVIISIDGITVNVLEFLSIISHEIVYRTTQYITKSKAVVFEKYLDELNGVYRIGGFNIVEIHCNNEFHKVMDNFVTKNNPPIRVNHATAQEHVPRAKT